MTFYKNETKFMEPEPFVILGKKKKKKSSNIKVESEVV